MKNKISKEKKIVNKKSIEKTKNAVLTVDIFENAIKKLGNKIDLDVKRLENKIDLDVKRLEDNTISKNTFENTIKRLEDKFVTKDDFKKEVNRIDKKFEDQTDTLLGAMYNIEKEIINKMEVMFEYEKDKNKIFFNDGLNDKEYKIKDLDKRLKKVEIKVFAK